MKRLLVGLIVVAFVAGLVIMPRGAHAFNPNLLMDDGTFDSQTMDGGQIDNFLNSFSSSCISTNNGFSAPDVVGYSPTGPSATGGFSYGADTSAGQIIYHAARVYGLNPQVILSTMEKEESLVTGSAGCSVYRYSAAMGDACPDSGGSYNYSGFELYSLHSSPVTSVNGICVNSSHEVGFSRQIITATWKFKFWEQRSEGNTGWNVQVTNFPNSGNVWDNSDDPPSCYSLRMTTGYRATCSGGSVVYWDGLYSIDGSTVQMSTGPTAALYNYTPHFSGNQSFVNIFSNWFGATYSPDLYTDSDGDGVVNRYDMCLFTSGSAAYFGCPANTTLDSSGFSGDFTGDGFNDLVVFSVFPDGRTFNTWLYPGSANGLGNPVLETATPLGPNNGGWDFQKSKAIATNVNGDSYTDLVVFHQGPHDEVVRNVFLGSASGLQQNNSMTVWQYPNQGWQWSRLRITGGGDFNGDTYGDVLVLSEFPDGATFNVWLYKGSASSGLQDPVLQANLGPGNGWNFTKTKPIAADANGDGYQDLVLFHQGPNDEVVRHILKGSSSGLQADDSNWVVWQFPSQGWRWSNLRLAGSGPFKGGSYDGIAAFSVFPDGRTYNVWLLNGAASGWGSNDFQMTLGPTRGGWDFTKSKPVAANVNNNGYRDLIILHRGPSNEIAFNFLQGSSTGLSLNNSWTKWQYPSQGWQWSNVTAVRNSN